MSRHSGSVSPQEQRVLFTPPTTGSDSTIRPDFEPRQVLDDLVSQWFEEIEETESPNKQLLPQFNLCAVPEFYSDPGLPVIPCDQIENPVLVIHTAGSQTSPARKRAKIDLANTRFALRFRAAQLHSTEVQPQKQVCNYWEPIFITVEFLESVHEEYLVWIFQLFGKGTHLIPHTHRLIRAAWAASDLASVSHWLLVSA